MTTTSRGSVVVDRRTVNYGTASSSEVASPYRPVELSLDGISRFWFFAAEITGLMFVFLSTFYIFAMPTVLTRPGRLHVMLSRIVKRTLDIIGATVGLILSIPIMLILPIIIKLESRGPVFYTQERVGVNRRKADRRYHQKADMSSNSRKRDRRRVDYMGRPFKVIKFRTMVNDAEKKSGPVWAVKQDPRITRVGAFLRKTRLDEVPQFINVLKGEMSLVGPRPERHHFVKELSTKIDGYVDRLEVKPGLTGLAQVENGYDTTVAGVADKIRWDLEYIRKRSLWYDIKILLRTVVVVITGRGAC